MDEWSFKQVSWDQIKSIPRDFNRGGASFTIHKKKQKWFCLSYESMPMGVTKTLYVTKKLGRICSIWVFPEFRRTGVASRIIENQIKHARLDGLKYLEAISKENLFLRNGFKYTKEYNDGSKFYRIELT